jgi:hypothetical protein
MNCPEDLGDICVNCPDGKKDSRETCQTCPIDAGACPNLCGNNVLDL